MREHRIEIASQGDPDVMRLVPADLPDPGPGEVRIRHAAIGVNFLDVMQRSGAAPLALPSGLGLEASGVVETVGPDVREPSPGTRAAYAGGPPGAYATARNLAAERCLPLPDGISHEQAAAILFKGLTAQYLLRDLAKAGPGRTLLVHSAAGGVGQLLARWATALGAHVIGVVSSLAKAAVARAAGCQDVIVSGTGDLAAQLRMATHGTGVDVVLDAVGRDTFEASLRCLKPRGMMVSFGAASGPAPPVEVARLGALGSLILTRPSVFHYTADPAEYRDRAADVLAALGAGHIRAEIGAVHDLADAARAHAELEARRTVGALVLRP